MDGLRDSLPFNQALYLLLDGQIRPLHQGADDAVGAGVGPVGLCERRLIRPAGIHVIDDAPGIVDFRVPELITVIPLPHRLQIFLQAVIPQHCFHLVRRKSKILRIIRCGDRHDFQIVKPRENGFPADPETPRHHREFQVPVGLQGGLEQGADQGSHPIVKAGKERVFQGNIVFVNQNNRFPARGGIQALRKVFQGILVFLRLCPALDKAQALLLHIIGQIRENPVMPPVFPGNFFPEAVKGVMIICLLHGLQRKADDRELSHSVPVFFPGGHDFRADEQFFVVLAKLKEIPEHAHVQGLPETARPGEQVHFPFHIQEIPDKQGLIYKVIALCNQVFKIIDAYRQRFPFHAMRLPSCCTFILLHLRRRAQAKAGP